MSCELSIIIPTYNERDNIVRHIEKLRMALEGITWEVIFVDDASPDGTAGLVKRESLKDPRIRLIERVGQTGLSSACIEGIRASRAPYAAVMDADMQHDETLLPYMLALLKDHDLDLVIGSRYIEGANIEQWSIIRSTASKAAIALAKILCRIEVKDPLSGYFMVKRGYFKNTEGRLSGRGFKILLDLLMASSAPVKWREVPYTFRTRQHGRSKLTPAVVMHYFLMVAGRVFSKKNNR